MKSMFVFSANPQCLLGVRVQCLFLSAQDGEVTADMRGAEKVGSGNPYQPDLSQLCVCLRSAPHNQPLTTHWGQDY